MSCAFGGIGYLSASSTARTEAMPCTSVQTPQMRWANAQASRGSRPRRMISIPRTIVPELDARVMRPVSSICASMRRCPSMRVTGSRTSVCVAMSGLDEIVRDQLDQAVHALVPLESRLSVVERLAAVGAARLRQLGAAFVDLVHLQMEDFVPQRVRPANVDHAAAT